ncbi:MAG TPA: VWA domain-containing protein [Planctomycetota bacterium]|nr:VWA domain-containing protein [Planctomycetota bacterium]
MNTTKLVFDCPLPPWAVAAAALVVLGVVVVFLRRDAGHLRPLVRRGILALVVVAALLLTGIVLSPKIIRTWPDPHKPLCTVLVDGSRSMLLADTYAGRLVERLGTKGDPAAPAGPREVTRRDVARLLLDPGPQGWLATVRESFDVAGWRFAGALDALPLAADTPPFEVNPEGYVTALGEALDEAARGAGGVRPRAIVLLSDGAWNTGRDPSEIARVLGRMNIPIFAVGIGNPSPPRDAAVTALRAPRSALLGDEVLLAAEVATSGMGAARLTVQLASGADVLAEKQVVTLPSGRPVTVSFSFIPDTPGLRSFTVRVPRQEGEQDASNNVARASIEVAERKIRVLLADAEPRWEFRFLRNVFERDPAVQLTVCLLRPGLGPIKGEGYLEALPTQKQQMADYDLVILGDIAREHLPDDFLKELVELVKARGSGLLVIAGRRHNCRGLLGTPLAGILPVAIEGALGDGRGEPFSVELTQDGAGHLVTRLAADPQENDALWSRLPKVRWSASVGGLQRGATALVVHPYRLAGPSKLPLLAVQRVGAGKVMFCGIEETWRWRQEVGDKYHYRFWAQTVRWMVKRQFAEGDPRARLSLDRAECDSGEAVEIEAYCLAPDGFPLENARVWARVEAEDGASQRLALAPAPGGWGIYRATFKPQKPGKYTLRPIVAAYGDEPLASAATLTVLRADLEKKFLAQDMSSLNSIALASRGQYLRIDESDRLPSLLAGSVERRLLTAEYSPCRHWLYYSVLALLLGAAWLIRKRSGLA